MSGRYYDSYYRLKGMRFYIPVLIREVLLSFVEIIVAVREHLSTITEPHVSIHLGYQCRCLYGRATNQKR